MAAECLIFRLIFIYKFRKAQLFLETLLRFNFFLSAGSLPPNFNCRQAVTDAAIAASSFYSIYRGRARARV